MGKLIGFVGCSGSGKSTCIKYLSKYYNIESVEISGRPFFKENSGSYDEQINEEIQTKIMYNNIEKIYQCLISTIIDNKNIVTSRNPIDVLAYSKVLNFGVAYEEQLKNTIKYLIPNMIIVYTSLDFKMTDKSDKIRGMNEEVRLKTDKEIKKVFEELNIKPYIIKGDYEQREKLLDELMDNLNIQLT